MDFRKFLKIEESSLNGFIIGFIVGVVFIFTNNMGPIRTFYWTLLVNDTFHCFGKSGDSCLLYGMVLVILSPLYFAIIGFFVCRIFNRK